MEYLRYVAGPSRPTVLFVGLLKLLLVALIDHFRLRRRFVGFLLLKLLLQLSLLRLEVGDFLGELSDVFLHLFHLAVLVSRLVQDGESLVLLSQLLGLRVRFRQPLAQNL